MKTLIKQTDVNTEAISWLKVWLEKLDAKVDKNQAVILNQLNEQLEKSQERDEKRTKENNNLKWLIIFGLIEDFGSAIRSTDTVKEVLISLYHGIFS